MASKRKRPDRLPALISALSNGPKSTPVLAKLLKLSSRTVYSLCRRAEAVGLVGSELGVTPGLYCVDCEKAVTNETYQSCHEEGHELRNMGIKVRTWFLMTGAKKPKK